MKQILFGTLCGIISLVMLSEVPAGEPAGEKRIAFTVPAAPWTLTFSADDFGVRRKQIDPSGRIGTTFLSDDDRHLNILILVGPVKGCQDGRTCRDLLWRAKDRSPANLQNVAFTEIGEASCIEFVDPRFQGHPVRQQNMLAVLVADGFRVDLHLTGSANSRNRDLFARIIKSIKFEPK